MTKPSVMFTCEITFPTTGGDREAMFEAALGVLAIWYKNGQIATDEWPGLIDARSRVTFVVSLPEADSLDAQYNNDWAVQELAKLREHGVEQPIINVLGFCPGTMPACGCPRPRSFVLFTNYLTNEGPVRCGDCFSPVPLYRLKADNHGEYLYILHWRDNYQACDTLQMHCSVGEAFGEEQLFKHDGELSQEGRETCRTIAEKTGSPTYYYLHKSRGTTIDDEVRRRCPSCRGAWLLDHKWHALFDFKCDRCCLLSNVACSLDE